MTDVMTAGTGADAAARPPRRPDLWPPWARLLAGAVVLAWVAMLVGGLVQQVHPATLAQLERDIRAGQVEVVRVNGGLPANAMGSAGVTLQWRSGWSRREATVVEASPGKPRREARSNKATVVDPGLRDRIRALDPDLRIEEAGLPTSGPIVFTMPVPWWAAVSALLVWFFTIMMVGAGPQPRRATRAAWAWLVVLAAPVGVPAYLALGGPTRALLVRPGAGRRLTGGWGFLLAVMLASTLGNAYADEAAPPAEPTRLASSSGSTSGA
jgi:hypothetical protein